MPVPLEHQHCGSLSSTAWYQPGSSCAQAFQKWEPGVEGQEAGQEPHNRTGGGVLRMAGLEQRTGTVPGRTWFSAPPGGKGPTFGTVTILPSSQEATEWAGQEGGGSPHTLSPDGFPRDGYHQTTMWIFNRLSDVCWRGCDRSGSEGGKGSRERTSQSNIKGLPGDRTRQ